MLKPKFTIDLKDCRLILMNNYICNGHYLINTKIVRKDKSSPIYKELSKVQFMLLGNYVAGERTGDFDESKIPSMIPNRNGYRPLTFKEAIVNEDLSITGYRFSIARPEPLPQIRTDIPPFEGHVEECVAINTDYVKLLELGHAFGKSKLDPVLVLDGNDPAESQVIAVIMPIRI